MNNRISQQYAEKYIKGGKATVIFHNTLTKVQVKFTILAAHKDKHNKRSEVTAYFVYKYGVPGWLLRIDMSNQTFLNPSSRDQPSIELAGNFNWIWKKIIARTVPEHIHLLHVGACSVCGRPLTDAISLESGIGPVCAGRI